MILQQFLLVFKDNMLAAADLVKVVYHQDFHRREFLLSKQLFVFCLQIVDCVPNLFDAFSLQHAIYRQFYFQIPMFKLYFLPVIQLILLSVINR